MPWKNNTPMDQRKEFVIKAMQAVNFRKLCQEYGISAKTGYKWKAKMIENGLGGVIEKSRRPKKHSLELNEREVCEIVKLKQAHLYWGPKKIRALYSRFIIAVECLADTKGERVKMYFEKVFRKYGLPEKIRSDNGVPFAHVGGVMGLSRLSAWWLSLGIGLERGRPGHPQDSGGHERMHRDIRTELEGLGTDQDAMDLWRHTFNFERPHEALNMKFPSDLFKASERRYEGTLEDLDYPGMASRKVGNRERIKWENQIFFISSSLVGWSVGLKQTQSHLLEVWFANLLLGFLNIETNSFQRSDISDL